MRVQRRFRWGATLVSWNSFELASCFKSLKTIRYLCSLKMYRAFSEQQMVQLELNNKGLEVWEGLVKRQIYHKIGSKCYPADFSISVSATIEYQKISWGPNRTERVGTEACASIQKLSCLIIGRRYIVAQENMCLAPAGGWARESVGPRNWKWGCWSLLEVSVLCILTAAFSNKRIALPKQLAKYIFCS